MAVGFLFISPSIAGVVFFTTMALEWIIMEPINRYLRLKTLKAEGTTLAKRAKYEAAVGQQAIAVSCEYCNELNAVKIDLNATNTFKCNKCGNDNKVVIDISTTRLTTPLETLKVENPIDIIDELLDSED